MTFKFYCCTVSGIATGFPFYREVMNKKALQPCGRRE